MNHILDLREHEVELDYLESDINWILGWALALIILVSGLAYTYWLDAGCSLNGVMTWQGKECIQ